MFWGIESFPYMCSRTFSNRLTHPLVTRLNQDRVIGKMLMPLNAIIWFVCFAIAALPIAALSQNPQSLITQADSDLCPTPILSRLQRHTVIQGETVSTIAQRYGLVPQSIISLNPALSGDSAPAGKVILIPPVNGIRVEVPSGATWREMGKAYGVRPDVLFEINGCQAPGKTAFIPGVTWTASAARTQTDYIGLEGYPLPSSAQVGLSYGWHTLGDNEDSYFHSGLDLLAEPGTPVLAAAAGTVIFTGQEGAYGYLVIIDHGNLRQTRYAHLSKIDVRVGQAVVAGDQIGLSGTTGRPDIAQPHLHFEIILLGTKVNPMLFL